MNEKEKNDHLNNLTKSGLYDIYFIAFCVILFLMRFFKPIMFITKTLYVFGFEYIEYENYFVGAALIEIIVFIILIFSKISKDNEKYKEFLKMYYPCEYEIQYGNNDLIGDFTEISTKIDERAEFMVKDNESDPMLKLAVFSISDKKRKIKRIIIWAVILCGFIILFL